MINRDKFILIFQIILFNIYCSKSTIANNTLDSLFSVLSKSMHDTSQVKTLCEITTLLIEEKKPDAKKYALQAVEKSKFISNSEYFNNSVSLYLKTIKNEETTEQKFQFLDQLFSKIKNYDYSKKSIIYLNKGLIFESIDSAISALSMFDKATLFATKSSDTLTLIAVYTTKGIFYKKKSSYTLSLESFITALKLSEYIGDTDSFFPICINLGTIYEQMADYDKAIDLYKKAEKVIDKENDFNAVAIVNYKIGKMLLRRFRYKEAEYYLKKVYEIHIQRNDKNGLIVSAAALSGVSYDLKQYPDFLKLIKISLENAEITQNQQGLASAYSAYGKYYEDVEKDYRKALEFYKRNLSLDFSKLQLSHIHLVYKRIYIIYEKLNDFKNAFDYYKLYNNLNDSLYNTENIKKQTEIKLDYEFDKIQRQKDIENLIKEKEQKLILEKERQSRNFFIIVGILAFFLFVLSFRSYRIKRKANILLALQKQQIEEINEELNQQNAEIAAQRDYLSELNNVLETKNTEIAEQKYELEIIHNELKDSINYAKQIQEAVLPSKDIIKTILTDYFVIYKPRNIVSGDFYWINKINNIVIIAVADCTGHGVPGSFMSMLGISLMNEIVRKKEVNKANQVLNLLRESVIEALRQTGKNEEQKDGMDMSLVVIKNQISSSKNQIPNLKSPKKESEKYSVIGEQLADNKHITSNFFNAQWAGANNPLWIVRSRQPLIVNNQSSIDNLIEFKPDKMPIAIYERMESFTNHEIILQKGDTIYLMSDGYQDQFGGTKNKKFLSKNLKELIITNCLLTMEEQKEMLEKTLVEWIGNGEQTDDITIFGIKI